METNKIIPFRLFLPTSLSYTVQQTVTYYSFYSFVPLLPAVYLLKYM